MDLRTSPCAANTIAARIACVKGVPGLTRTSADWMASNDKDIVLPAARVLYEVKGNRSNQVRHVTIEAIVAKMNRA